MLQREREETAAIFPAQSVAFSGIHISDSATDDLKTNGKAKVLGVSNHLPRFGQFQKSKGREPNKFFLCVQTVCRFAPASANASCQEGPVNAFHCLSVAKRTGPSSFESTNSFHVRRVAFGCEGLRKNRPPHYLVDSFSQIPSSIQGHPHSTCHRKTKL